MYQSLKTFNILALEEQKHIEFIQKEINKLDEGISPDLDLKSKFEETGFFSERATSEFIQQTVSEAMVPDLPVLRMAYLIEKDFAEFYEKSAVNATGEAKKCIGDIGLLGTKT